MVTKERTNAADRQAEAGTALDHSFPQKTADKEKKQRRKKNRGPMMKLSVTAVLIALLLFALQKMGIGTGLGGGGLGLWDRGPSDRDSSESSSDVSRAPVPSEEVPEDTELLITPKPAPTEVAKVSLNDLLTSAPTELPKQVVEIRVVERQIWADGVLMEDFDALKAYVDSVHTDDMNYRLVDAHAIHNTYNLVLELLSTKTNKIERSVDY